MRTCGTAVTGPGPPGQAILIDIGGVLIPGYLPAAAAEWGARLGVSPQAFLAALFGGSDDQALTGRVSEPRWWAVVAGRLRAAYAVAIVALAAAIVPTVQPFLPPGDVRGYFVALHLAPPAEEKARLGALPQYFADQFGWPELAATVAAVYYALPPADRAKAYVLGGNYGEAAAVDIYDAGRGLPPTLSGHNQYGLWGPRGYDGSVLIDIGGNVKDDLRVCRSATLAATFSAPYVMPFEDHLGIVVCRGLRVPLARFWNAQKFII